MYKQNVIWYYRTNHQLRRYRVEVAGVIGADGFVEEWDVDMTTNKRKKAIKWARYLADQGRKVRVVDGLL